MIGNAQHDLDRIAHLQGILQYISDTLNDFVDLKGLFE
jgi:hypothetical protein